MVTTRVTNRSNVDVEIKEGNAGVYSKVGVVKHNDSLCLNLNEHATYREYWCAMQPSAKGEKVILTSDDCAEHEEVEIYIGAAGQLAWKAVRDRKSVRLPSDARFEKIFGWFSNWNFFKKTPKTLPVDPQAPPVNPQAPQVNPQDSPSEPSSS